MKLKVRVEEFAFDINVGSGLNDFVWLALSAAKFYGKKKYPNGNYLPACLKIGGSLIPPRTKICDFFKIQDEIEELGEITVEIQQLNSLPKEDHLKWFDLAFGKLRNIMTYKFIWLPEKRPDIREKEKQKGVQYRVRINYKIFPELAHEFNASNYKTVYDLDLLETELDANIIEYSAEMELPYGEITIQSIFWFIPVKDEEVKYNFVQLAKEMSKIKNERIPIPVSQIEMAKKIKEMLRQVEDQAQKLDDKDELRADQSLSGLCPFTFETIWNLIENNQEDDRNLSLENLEENVKEIVAPLFVESLNKVYEIFFQYSFFYEQPSDKKDELMITIQDLMHFLKFYQICPDSQTLFQFLDFYDVEKKRTKNFKLTLNLSNGIKFPEFVLIIIKAAHFLQTVNLISESEGFGDIVKLIIEKMIRVDSSDEESSEFQKHMKYNLSLVSFLRENSSKLISLFLTKLQDSIQIAEKKYHMLREEIKSIVLESGFKGENIEEILNSCYHELLFDNFQGFEGIFYYEFLQCVQWMSLVLVGEDEIEEEREEEREEGVEVLIEKMKYFLGQMKVE